MLVSEKMKSTDSYILMSISKNPTLNAHIQTHTLHFSATVADFFISCTLCHIWISQQPGDICFLEYPLHSPNGASLKTNTMAVILLMV